MPTLIIIPTWQETQSLPPLVEQLLLLPDEEYHVLVVDDSSPDGTGEIAETYAKHNPEQVYVLHRGSRTGLRDAYFAGFRWALEHNYETVVQMDADGSHNPEYLPHLTAPVLNGQADVVTGSRWLPGGGTLGWSWYRKLLSKGGSWYARTLLKLPYTDLTGGYKCYNREVLQYLLQEGNVTTEGYGFQIETILRAHRVGFRVTETPILFSDRVHGESKMTAHIIWEAFRKVTSWSKTKLDT